MHNRSSWLVASGYGSWLFGRPRPLGVGGSLRRSASEARFVSGVNQCLCCVASGSIGGTDPICAGRFRFLWRSMRLLLSCLGCRLDRDALLARAQRRRAPSACSAVTAPAGSPWRSTHTAPGCVATAAGVLAQRASSSCAEIAPPVAAGDIEAPDPDLERAPPALVDGEGGRPPFGEDGDDSRIRLQLMARWSFRQRSRRGCRRAGPAPAGGPRTPRHCGRSG